MSDTFIAGCTTFHFKGGALRQKQQQQQSIYLFS